MTVEGGGVVLTLTKNEAAYLREAIAARHGIEAWTGDCTHWPVDGVDSQDLYFRLGGTFDEMMASVVEISRPHPGNTPSDA